MKYATKFNMRWVAFILVLAIMINFIPVDTFAAKKSDELVEITKQVNLKTEPYKDAENIIALMPGDVLTVKGYCENKFGNIWIETVCGDTTGYVYMGSTKLHECIFNKVSDDLEICKCGTYKLRRNGTVSVGDAVALRLPMNDIAGALAELGVAATGVAAAAIPYMVAVVVGGVTVYLAVSASGLQVKVEEVALDAPDKIKDFDFDDKAPYHKAYFIKGVDGLVITKDGMTMKEAKNYLKSITNNPVYGLTSNFTGKPFLSLWCRYESQMETLALAFINDYKGYYSFGSSKLLDEGVPDEYTEPDMCPEVDIYGNMKFFHYHLWTTDYFSRWTKVSEIHLFFSEPVIRPTKF